MARRTVPLALLVASLTAASSSGCDDGGGTGSGDDGGPAMSACAKDTRKDVYAVGLTKASAKGELTVKVLGATPAPPAKATNALTVQVLDAAGAPLDGATLAVVPFMPDHGHGSSVKPTVTAQGGGRFEITNLYYPMPGLWQLTVTVQPAAGAASDVVFAFCIDG